MLLRIKVLQEALERAARKCWPKMNTYLTTAPSWQDLKAGPGRKSLYFILTLQPKADVHSLLVG